MKKKTSIVLLLFLCFTCAEESAEPVGENNTIEFETSPSPIPLGDIQASFIQNISYGPDERNVFDIYLPTSEAPTPLVIYIHGGGFLGGEKENAYTSLWNGTWDFPSEIRLLLSENIAFASINYRLLAFEGDQEGVIKPLSDSKRCLQYIRSISPDLNIDPYNIVLCGSSAGAGTSQWLAFSDDMADPNNEDPVLRESTRVNGFAVKATQASYDLLRYESDIFNDYNFSWLAYFEMDPSMQDRFMSFYGIDQLSEFNSVEITNYRQNIDMLGMLSSDDPEFWVSNPQNPVVEPTQANILNHHAYHARTLKEFADAVGVPNVIFHAEYEDPSGEEVVDFMIRKAKEN
ncbi:MAG: alpha/beta hydrolase [Bacteroidota bacterium]